MTEKRDGRAKAAFPAYSPKTNPGNCPKGRFPGICWPEAEEKKICLCGSWFYSYQDLKTVSSRRRRMLLSACGDIYPQKQEGTPQKRTAFVGRGEAKAQVKFSACGK